MFSGHEVYGLLHTVVPRALQWSVTTVGDHVTLVGIYYKAILKNSQANVSYSN